MPFCTTLEVAHIDSQNWRLTRPLVWKGRWEYMIIRSGFETDFASIPKMVRWLLDNAGRNAEAGVLHDAVWRESKLPDPRVDPWFADGMLRRALRETGSTALTRTLIWAGVRVAATVRGRFGKQGPSLLYKIVQLLGVLALAAISALGPTLVTGVGLIVFWVFNWLTALAWYVLFERRVFTSTNWPWPVKTKSVSYRPPQEQLLVIIPFKPNPYDKSGSASPSGPTGAFEELERLLAEHADITDEQITIWAEAIAAAR
ncbi:MAG: uncharacterized protein JWM34_1955 [Ilumatobacteraceae bacterium]|nr:uncharacterized protein [Ilumatobacteraceae bacterium]